MAPYARNKAPGVMCTTLARHDGRHSLCHHVKNESLVLCCEYVNLYRRAGLYFSELRRYVNSPAIRTESASRPSSRNWLSLFDMRCRMFSGEMVFRYTLVDPSKPARFDARHLIITRHGIGISRSIGLWCHSSLHGTSEPVAAWHA